MSGNGKQNYYFSQETEDAIIRYTELDDDMLKNKLYCDKIEYPFYKLAENIYNTFKFSYFDSEPQDVMHEVVSFMVLNMHKFKEGKGKAFSYFSVVAKNYLILRNNNNYKRYNKTDLLSDLEDVWEVPDDFELQERNNDMQEFTRHMVEFWENNMVRVFKKDRDVCIADSILELFRRADTIENYNKKSLYLLIRERTGYKTQHITKVINKMKDVNEGLLNDFINTGEFPTNDLHWPIRIED